VQVLRLPDGEDPDSFLLKWGGERYQELLSALSLVDFLIAEAGKRYDVGDRGVRQRRS
jgi:DNA primase